MTLFPQPKLIALTGYGQESDKLTAFAAGFDIHLTKPAEIAHLSNGSNQVAFLALL
jgi:CheY-like chemotaxis protein